MAKTMNAETIIILDRLRQLADKGDISATFTAGEVVKVFDVPAQKKVNDKNPGRKKITPDKVKIHWAKVKQEKGWTKSRKKQKTTSKTASATRSLKKNKRGKMVPKASPKALVDQMRLVKNLVDTEFAGNVDDLIETVRVFKEIKEL